MSPPAEHAGARAVGRRPGDLVRHVHNELVRTNAVEGRDDVVREVGRVDGEADLGSDRITAMYHRGSTLYQIY